MVRGGPPTRGGRGGVGRGRGVTQGSSPQQPVTSSARLAAIAIDSGAFVDDPKNPNGIVQMENLTLEGNGDDDLTNWPQPTNTTATATTTHPLHVDENGRELHGCVWCSDTGARGGRQRAKQFPAQDYPGVHSDFDASRVFREPVDLTLSNENWMGVGVPSEKAVEDASKYWSNKNIKDNVFLLHHFLGQNECRRLITVATPFLSPVDKFFSQRYRKSDRAILHAPKLAAQIYQRILPFLRPSDYRDRFPMCFGQNGVWVPFGLNSCIKLSRYAQNGMFAQHRDGPWIPRDDQASMYTVVVYLNDNFTGGETSFYNTHVEKGTRSLVLSLGRRQSDWNFCVKPVSGMAAVFNHDVWHGGRPVRDGVKWILRTEIVFQKVHSFKVDRFAFASDSSYRAAVSLYEESHRALCEGRREDFVDIYQQVIVVQREAMLLEEATVDRRPFISSKANPDVVLSVLTFLEDHEVVGLLTVSSGTYHQVMQSDLWEFRTRDRFPQYFATFLAARATASADLDAASSSLQEASSTTTPLAPAMDWYTIYFQQQLMVHGKGLKSYTPCGVWVSLSGLQTLRLRKKEMRSNSTYRDSFSRGIHRIHGRSTCDDIPFSFSVFANWFGDWVYAYPYHMNQPPGEVHEMRWKPTGDDSSRHQSDKKICDDETGVVDWSVASVCIDSSFDPVWHPLLLVGHPQWFQDGKIIPKQEQSVCNDLFELLRTPAIRIVHPALASAAAVNAINQDVALYSADGIHLRQRLRYLLAVVSPLHPYEQNLYSVGIVDRGRLLLITTFILDLSGKDLTDARDMWNTRILPERRYIADVKTADDGEEVDETTYNRPLQWIFQSLELPPDVNIADLEKGQPLHSDEDKDDDEDEDEETMLRRRISRLRGESEAETKKRLANTQDCSMKHLTGQHREFCRLLGVSPTAQQFGSEKLPNDRVFGCDEIRSGMCCLLAAPDFRDHCRHRPFAASGPLLDPIPLEDHGL